MIDLHVHTNYSDGKMSPNELLVLYNTKEFEGISFTDHDSIKVYDELKSLKIPGTIKIIPGVELTLNEMGYEFHILSYGFTIDNDKKEFLKIIGERKRYGTANRIKEINRKLKLDGLKEVNKNELMCGKIPHSYQIAKAITECNNLPYEKSYEKYVTPVRFSILRNLPSINDAHQVGFKNLILAHPFSKYHSLKEYCKFTQNDYKETLINLFETNLSGIEVYSGRHSPEQIAILESITQGNN